MKHRLFTNSKKTWEAMLADIASAEKSIYIEMYAFLDDTEGHDFIEEIRKRSESGLKIIIIADLFGSSEIKKSSVRKLRDSGAEFIFFDQWLKRTHRKIMIIDEKIAFIGGVNIGENFARWNDLHLRITNKGLVRSITRSFANTYRIVGGKNLAILKLGRMTFSKKFKSWIIHHWPRAQRKNRLKRLYIEKISKAKESIIITTPYFSPPLWLMRLLRAAALRQIKIEIIIPKKTNHFLADKINYFMMRRLHRYGIRFLLFPEMNHAKSLFIDDSECLIGSQNLDILSFYLNPEMGMLSKDKKLVRDFRKVIQAWKKITIPFKHDSRK